MLDKHLFDESPLAQLVIDPVHDQIILVNDQATHLLSQDKQQLLSTQASRLFAACFPDFVTFSQQLIDKGSSWTDDLIVSSNNQETRVEIWGKRSFLDEKTLLYFTIQKADELERKRDQGAANRHYESGVGHWNRVSKVFQEFERENQLILDAAGEGIYGVNADGITTFVNPAAQKILGYTAAELAGRNMHSAVHYNDKHGHHYDSHQCPIFAAFRDGTVHEIDDDVFWRKDGTPISVEYTSTPIKDNGIIVGAVVIFRDITQKKANQQKLIEALNEVETLKNRLELENAYLQEEINSEFNYRHIVGNSPAIQKVNQQIQLVAPTEVSVLIIGESGTGKELIARAIHDLSPRSERSLIRVNCAAIPENLFESEFFGHVKGAFTSANQDRVGRFELANGGTLFLDEVGEIPLHLQGKLLRVLQEKQFERVGDDRTRNVDVRILAATNKDLKQLVKQGKFREDLYFRLNVFPVESIPLRKRLDDIPLLTQHFLKRACIRANKPLLKIPLAEVEKLKKYHWPGNVRELENVIEREVILSQGEKLRIHQLNYNDSFPKLDEDIPLDTTKLMTEAELKELDRKNILAALKKCNGKVSGDDGAALLLGLPATTLASRMKKYNIDGRALKS
jgi:PAS domain S-box-containing protein